MKVLTKGIAVTYIIAIILGVLVIGAVGYWLFMTIGPGTSVGPQKECENKRLQWCNEWLKTGFDRDRTPEAVLGGWNTFAPGCGQYLIVEPTDDKICRSILGLGSLKDLGEACSNDNECLSGFCDGVCTSR